MITVETLEAEREANFSTFARENPSSFFRQEQPRNNFVSPYYFYSISKEIAETANIAQSESFYYFIAPQKDSLPGILAKRAVDKLEQEFNELAGQWYRETRMFSFIKQKAMHKAYQEIIGMGESALPYIFKELQKQKGDWIWALNAITREDPAKGITNFREAVRSWLNWGKQHRYIK
jgi:hypothetical protein